VTDIGFVLAGYAVILGGAALYAVALVRRLARAREESARLRRETEGDATE
jgi:hypothetical protein